jgi:DNA-3-methyladenine glycosylase II
MDPEVERRLRADPAMDRLVEAHGPLTVEPAADAFERLCVSIVNQQLSTASANAIRERLFDELDGAVTPETVLAAEETTLREAGLSTTKVEYLQSAAEAFARGDLSRDQLDGRSNEAVTDVLTDIRGVGEWTADMFLIFVMGREDVLPLGDLAVRRGIEEVYGDGGSMDRSEMREIADRWRPYRSYGTRYVWAEYESDPKD